MDKIRKLKSKGEMLSRRITKLAEWDESKHPRDPGGKDGGQFVPSNQMKVSAKNVLLRLSKGERLREVPGRFDFSADFDNGDTVTSQVMRKLSRDGFLQKDKNGVYTKRTTGLY